MASSGRRCNGGHMRSVLSVAVTSPSNVRVLSGGESGELAVWTPDGANIHKMTVDDDGDVASIICSAANANHVYVSCGEKIYFYDLRRLEKPVNVCHYNEDEINQLALNKTENYLAAADDSGNIKVLDLGGDEMKVYKTLRKHTNICATVGFAPNKTWDLYSAGYDSALIQWNYAKSRSSCVFEMKDLEEETWDDVQSFVVSPPFVHSLAVSRDGGLLACGTENGLVHVFDCAQRLVRFGKTLYGHSRGVSQVHFPTFTDEKYLVSCGNDTRICFWDVEGVGNSKAATANGGTASVGNGKSKGSSKQRKQQQAEAQQTAASEADVASAQTRQKPKFEIVYDEKMNCVTSGSSSSHENFLVIADTTTSPFILPFPL